MFFFPLSNVYHHVRMLSITTECVHFHTTRHTSSQVLALHTETIVHAIQANPLVHIPLPFGKTQRVFKSSIQRVLRRPLFCSPPFCACQNCTICPPASDPRNAASRRLNSSFQRENILNNQHLRKSELHTLSICLVVHPATCVL